MCWTRFRTGISFFHFQRWHHKLSFGSVCCLFTQFVQIAAEPFCDIIYLSAIRPLPGRFLPFMLPNSTCFSNRVCQNKFWLFAVIFCTCSFLPYFYQYFFTRNYPSEKAGQEQGKVTVGRSRQVENAALYKLPRRRRRRRRRRRSSRTFPPVAIAMIKLKTICQRSLTLNDFFRLSSGSRGNCRGCPWGIPGFQEKTAVSA